MTALELILAAAARYPDHVAIEEADGTRVTYRDLVGRAHVCAREVRPGSMSEIPATRSADFISRCIGTWIAGAAWIPIDPKEPPARLAAIRACIAGDAEADLAYVIATSGSSGTPKLVMVAHGGLPALLRSQVEAFELGPHARSLWLHAPVFDASISDWGTALASGATLVVPSAGAMASAVALRDELVRRAISHVDLPPPLLAHVEDPPPALRVVVLGGEPCAVERVAALARRVRVVVVYGPTEATVCSSLVVVDAATWRRPLIGDPLPGVHYRVIDGELWIGGDGLALGYAGDAAETARRFVDIDGIRMYRTGDRVQACEGGLAFAGRVDRQRKLRGRRVELEEIEAALRRVPGVRDAAVALRTIGRGEPRLVGFVDGEVDAAVVRAALRMLVPAWMVPPRIVIGPQPRTVTGKIDHATLATLPLPASRRKYATALEADLAALWTDVLGVDAVDPGERFSDAGGDSLARISLQASASARAIALDPSALAGDPTFHDIVERVRAGTMSRALTVRECEARGRGALTIGEGADEEGAPGTITSEVGLSKSMASGVILRRTMDRPEVLIPRRTMDQTEVLIPRRTMDQTEVLIPRRTMDHRAGARVSGAIESRTVGSHAHGAVLITGATGMLGRHLVQAWRARDDRQVIALVRAPDEAAARARLGIDDAEVICGDVGRPRFGLDERAWEALASRVSAVVHGAAAMRLDGGWEDHAATNVDGTAEVARLVAAGNDVAWHHVSTLSVFVGTDREAGRHAEASDPDPAAVVFGGYAQTKIAAEAIARAQRGRSAPTTVFRLGLLVGEARRDRDQLGMTIRGLARLGAVPEGAGGLRFDVTPVAYAADAIAALALRAEQRACDAVHHVAAARAATFGELVAAMRAAGVALVELAPEAWIDRARGLLGDPDVAMAYVSLGRAHPDAATRARMRPFDLFLATAADFSVEDTRALLVERGVAPPEIDAAMLGRLVRAALAEAT